MNSLFLDFNSIKAFARANLYEATFFPYKIIERQKLEFEGSFSKKTVIHLILSY